MRTSPSTRPTWTPASGPFRSGTRSTRPPRPCARCMTRGTSASRGRSEAAARGDGGAVAGLQEAEERLGEAGHVRVRGQDPGGELQPGVAAEPELVDQPGELDA